MTDYLHSRADTDVRHELIQRNNFHTTHLNYLEKALIPDFISILMTKINYVIDNCIYAKFQVTLKKLEVFWFMNLLGSLLFIKLKLL